MLKSQTSLKEITAVFVAHGSSVPVIQRIRDACVSTGKIADVDVIDDSEAPILTHEKHEKTLSGLEAKHPVLVLGVNEWSTISGEGNPGESDALYYAGGGFVYGRQPKANATCLIADSLARLEEMLPLKKGNFEERDKVKLVVVYGQQGGHMGRQVYETLIRRFPNLLPVNFLCFKTLDDKAAKLIASRIRSLV